ncbi:MAG: hypothetical protein GXP42_02840 [Chloroflexi bacterium]|nr:hypothetical protein [Chloroflexota bacterium]
MAVESVDQHHVRSWYGLSAEIIVEYGLWHLVRVGRVALPHPPLVNLVLRRGQPRTERLYLSFLHEFGHLQTLPVALAHALLLVVTGCWRGRGFKGTVFAILTAIVAHQALWELASESYVMVAAGPEYRRIYRDHPNLLGQIIFWGGMTALTVLLSRKVMRGPQTEHEADCVSHKKTGRLVFSRVGLLMGWLFAPGVRRRNWRRWALVPADRCWPAIDAPSGSPRPRRRPR